MAWRYEISLSIDVREADLRRGKGGVLGELYAVGDRFPGRAIDRLQCRCVCCAEGEEALGQSRDGAARLPARQFRGGSRGLLRCQGRVCAPSVRLTFDQA